MPLPERKFLSKLRPRFSTASVIIVEPVCRTRENPWQPLDKRRMPSEELPNDKSIRESVASRFLPQPRRGLRPLLASPKLNMMPIGKTLRRRILFRARLAHRPHAFLDRHQ